MKKIRQLFTAVIAISLLFACKKEELLHPDEGTVVKLEIKGYVMDTLEFVNNDKVIGTAFDNDFKFTGNLFNAKDKIFIRKKIGGAPVGSIEVAETPFNQVKKIFYDGTTLSDNVVLTPVSDPANMGFRIRFSTPFAGFYGGPVDVEFFDFFFDWNTFEFVYTPLGIVAEDVTGAFGGFLELPPLEADHTYSFKVYKAGTKDLPYNGTDHLLITDPANNYGQFDFNAGVSKLISISPYLVNQGADVYDGYAVADFSAAFR